VRITGVGTAWKAYIGESDTVIATLTASGATSAELLRMGIISSNVSAQVYLRRLAFTVDGAYIPTQFAAPDATTTYISIQDLRNFTGIDSSALSDGPVARLIRLNEHRVDEIFAGANGRRTKLIFGPGGTETSEDIDFVRARDGSYARTLYPFITTLTTLTYYGGSAYQSMTSGRTSDYYASTDDLEQGKIKIRITIPYEQNSLQATYTWGITEANEIKRRQAARLCLYLSAIDCYNASLQHGAADVFAARVDALKEEVDELTKKFTDTKTQTWMVV
jgi:hypothetical protein